MSLIVDEENACRLLNHLPRISVDDLKECFSRRGVIFQKQSGEREHTKPEYWFISKTRADHSLKISFVYSNFGDHILTDADEPAAIEAKLCNLVICDTNQGLQLSEQFFSLATHCSAILRTVTGLNEREINQDYGAALSCTNSTFCQVYDICTEPLVRKHIGVRLSCLERFEQEQRAWYSSSSDTKACR
jgi:hypothetical protein